MDRHNIPFGKFKTTNRSLPEGSDKPAPIPKERKPRIDPKADQKAYLAVALAKLHDRQALGPGSCRASASRLPRSIRGYCARTAA